MRRVILVSDTMRSRVAFRSHSVFFVRVYFSRITNNPELLSHNKRGTYYTHMHPAKLNEYIIVQWTAHTLTLTVLNPAHPSLKGNRFLEPT